MTRYSLSRALLLVVISLSAAAQRAAAQIPEPGAVSATGVVSISRQPEKMRLQIALQGKGVTLKDALSIVRTRAESARKQLTALGAEKGSIKVENSKVSQKDANQNNMRMQMMMIQRMQQGGNAKPKNDVPELVIASALLTAEWKLDSKHGDEQLIAVNILQEKIKEADLGGAKDTETLSPEEKELLEESEDEANMYANLGNTGEAKPGEPVFLFVGRISDAERDKALAEAFTKAKTNAARLAKAAGAQLGNLKSLTSNSASGDWSSYNRYGMNNSAAYQVLQAARQTQSEDGDDNETNNEALGIDLDAIKINVTVTAAFDLQRAK
ncbi:MAG TPA: SIMPL domain-containing protein [Planctomycetaceae bacterium]|nr:SIMPL domain-containing protein [Planctomycetaceae bacterium]